MARFRFGQSSKGGRIRQSGTDALQLVVDYIKQETLTPLKGLGRYLVFGILGSITLSSSSSPSSGRSRSRPGDSSAAHSPGRRMSSLRAPPSW
ncbi:MAG: hypothetical protein ACYCSX_07505 [Acidimicrobiales bacterium]